MLSMNDLNDMTYYEYYHNELNINLVQNIKDKVGDYIPPWWYNKHLGAIIPFGKNVGLPYEIETFETEQSIFQGHWYPKKPHIIDLGDKPINIILLLPGLGLSAKHNFAQNFCEYVSRFGYYVVVVGTRGLDIPLKTNRFWHSGKPEDPIYLIEQLKKSFGSKLRLFLIGYSAGSNSVVQILSYYSRNTKTNTTKRKVTITTTTTTNTNNTSTNTYNAKPNQSSGNDSMEDTVICGAICVCTCGLSYIDARKRLENDTFGKYFYSAAMTRIYKEILRRNSHIHDSAIGGKEFISTIISKCQFLSDYDSCTLSTLYHFESEDDFNKSMSMNEALCSEITVPLLTIQPADDPLHVGQARKNMCLNKILTNPNIIYMEPKYGSHFGFYEGGMHEAFSNKTSYTYPAKVAVCYFDTILDNKENEINIREI